MSFETALTTFIFLCITMVLYLIPALIASGRKHRNRSAILVLNIVGGWTVLFWLGALVWAFTSNVEGNQS